MQEGIQKFNNRGEFTVTLADLPLSCPMPNMALWDAHPRVYLPIEKTGEATCPYCGAHYFLGEQTIEEKSVERIE